jgi:TRAP-type C4-dicarboxylate transport system permease small subunit
MPGLLDLLEGAAKTAMKALIVGMVLLIFSQVVFRYALNHPLAWTEELSRHFMVWAAFLGAAVGYRKKAHMGVDILVAHLAPPSRRVVERMAHIATAGFAGFLLYQGGAVVSKTMQQLSSALTIPMGYIYASVPVGGALMAVFALEKLRETWATDTRAKAPGR